MAHILFVDESGHDRQQSPYEVLAGVSVEDQDLWNLVRSLHEAEERHFGARYTKGQQELKAKKILSRERKKAMQRMVHRKASAWKYRLFTPPCQGRCPEGSDLKPISKSLTDYSLSGGAR